MPFKDTRQYAIVDVTEMFNTLHFNFISLKVLRDLSFKGHLLEF